MTAGPVATGRARGRDDRIRDVIRCLGPGEIVTYGEIADDAGFPRMSRLVGRLLARGVDDDVAWWRVVTSSGRLVPGREQEQAELLGREGVSCDGGRVRHAPVGRFSRTAAVPQPTPTLPRRSPGT